MRRLAFALAFATCPLPALAQEILATYWANSGSLPPEYAWEVNVTIGTDGAVVLKRCKGYETEGPGCITRKGKGRPAEIQAIRDAVLASGLADKPAKLNDTPPIGGGASGGSVLLDGVEVKLPPWPAPTDVDRVAPVLSAVRAAIPDRLVKKFIDNN